LKKREPGVSERPSVGPVARELGRSRVAAAGDVDHGTGDAEHRTLIAIGFASVP
jgi:hypothetical protein